MVICSKEQTPLFATDSADFRKNIVKKGKTMRNKIEESTEKFALFVDLGIITVPDDYVHENRLKTFNDRNCKMFCHYNDSITDLNFPNPTRVMKPGDKLRVCAFKQVVGERSTSEERMVFLDTQKADYVGAQGLSLLLEQKRHLLPKGKRYKSYNPAFVGKWYTSFDQSDRLWKDDDGDHRVPKVICYSDGTYEFNLGKFETRWYNDDFFLCFRSLDNYSISTFVTRLKKYFELIKVLVLNTLKVIRI
jgi:hypothetical protein